MRRDTIFIAGLILLIGVMFGFGSKLGMKFQRALTGSLPDALTSANLATVKSTVEGYGTLHTLTAATPGSQTVPVYSRYPFSLKNEILIAAGKNEGVKEGDVILFQGSILGNAEKVFSDSALIETIFDSRFKISVRIGAAATDALLVGGPEPRVTLIQASSVAAENDQVYSAGEGWPYGVTLGALHNIKGSDSSLFRDGALRVFYNPASLNEVTVLSSGKQ